MDTTYIETERLILRSWRVTDRAVFAEINSNNKVMKYFPKPLSIEESNGFVDRINSEFEETDFGLYAVEIKKTGEFIGYVGFHRFTFDVPFSPGWEIGWRISDKFWNKGYATEAAMACIKYAREKKLCNYCCPVKLWHDRNWPVFISYSMKLTRINVLRRHYNA